MGRDRQSYGKLGSMTLRGPWLLVFALLAASCGSAAGPAAERGPQPVPSTTASSSVEPAPRPSATPASAPAEPSTTAGRPSLAPTEIVVIGDSFGRQFVEAVRVLMADRPDIELRYLMSAGPAFAGDDWAAAVAEFVPRPGRSTVFVTFGTWQSTPPEGVVDRLAQADLDAEITAFLEPVAVLATPQPPSLLLRPDVAENAANERLQQANAATRPLAVAAGLDVYEVTTGDSVVAGVNVVWVGPGGAEVAYPVRTPLDATHYCPAAALVMMRNGLERHGISIGSVTEANVAALFTATEGLGLFIDDGCEPLG